MGRDARAREKRQVKVTLEKGDYWELIARRRLIAELQGELVNLQLAKQQEIRRAGRAQDECMDRVAKLHPELDLKAAWRFSDKGCTIIVEPIVQPPAKTPPAAPPAGGTKSSKRKG